MKLKRIKESKPIVRQNDVLLITGDGKSLPDDLLAFYTFGVPHDTLCIGRSIKMVVPPVLHYADVDADEGKWVAENLHTTYPGKINGNLYKHTIGDVPWFDICWDTDTDYLINDTNLWYGSTSLFAVLAGVDMGYDKIVLAGCPMDSKGHWYFDNINEGPNWKVQDYQAWFEFMQSDCFHKVRSLSGYTKTLLGQPTEGFFHGIF